MLQIVEIEDLFGHVFAGITHEGSRTRKLREEMPRPRSFPEPQLNIASPVCYLHLTDDHTDRIRTDAFRFHPRHRRRGSAGREVPADPHALSAGAERLPAHRPRQVDLPELRHRPRIRRRLQPADGRHQSDQGGRRVRRVHHRRREVADRRLGRPVAGLEAARQDAGDAVGERQAGLPPRAPYWQPPADAGWSRSSPPTTSTSSTTTPSS